MKKTLTRLFSTLIVSILGAAATDISLAYVFKGDKPKTLEPCLSPFSHFGKNLIGIYSGIAGPGEKLYSDQYLASLDKATQQELLKEERRINVMEHVRLTEELPDIASQCYPTMITAYFARSAVNFSDYRDTAMKQHPDLTPSEIDEVVDGFYMPLREFE